jgi:hypothetical protein
MSLPKFTAEASLGPTVHSYWAREYYGTANFGLYPQQNGGPMDEGWDQDEDTESVMDMAEHDAGMDMADISGEEMDMEVSVDHSDDHDLTGDAGV